MAEFHAHCYLFCFTCQGKFFFILVVVGGKEKEVTVVGSAVGVHWYEYEGFCVGGHFVAGKKEALRCDKAWRPQ